MVVPDEREGAGADVDSDAGVIGGRLRAAADALVAGPAPLDEILGRGRRARLRRRLAAGAASLATVGVCLTAVLVMAPDGATPPDPPPPIAPAPSPAEVPPDGLRVVGPGESVEVADQVSISLSSDEDYELTVADYTPAPPWGGESGFGSGAAPRLTLSVAHWTVRERSLYHGFWRSENPPDRVVVELGDREYDATVLALPGNPGWGVFLLDATGLDATGLGTDRTARVTARDANGAPFASAAVSPGR
ncbi:hypothetical protein [Streptomyces hainanensis]|uniref:Uncharacterized protein n=1 Tax=Streptomyces hainanensis TaxID=402648 RepID=A0A4R4T2Q2_9ACTN|nr:hypothetical protein [Streptomyces hainanensis]TDC70997.1 hypothetical protein E1283_24060 [Streptomyces hainanensis]